MPIKPEHLDELLAGYEKPEDLLGEEGLFKRLKKALLERALGAELTHHLGYEKGDPAQAEAPWARANLPMLSIACWPSGRMPPKRLKCAPHRLPARVDP